LGVEGGELNSNTSKELGIKETEGFYIKRVNKNTGAEKSGLIKGDIIKKIDNQNVTSYAELNGYISTKRPNDKVQVTIIRNDKTMTIPVTLTKSDVINTQFKGLDLENIGSADKKKFRISYGVKIKEIDNDKLSAYANDLKGGIILSIGNVKAVDVETVSKALSNLDENQAVQIEMLTVNGQVVRLIL
jgi:S1-C subfamily serine protease